MIAFGSLNTHVRGDDSIAARRSRSASSFIPTVKRLCLCGSTLMDAYEMIESEHGMRS